MAFEVQQLPGERIIISTLYQPFEVEPDLRAIGEIIKDILNETPGVFYFITDMTRIDQVTFGTVVSGLVAVTKGEFSFLLKHERLIPIFVVTSGLVKFAVESLSQRQYGSLHIRRFETLDEAIEYSRQELDDIP
jgi:hypothetical protein